MNVIEGFKGLTELVQKYNDIDLYKKILSLQTEVLAVGEENVRLKREISDLQSKLALRESLHFDKNLYWSKAGEKIDGPFCSACYEKDREARRMLILHNGNVFACKICQLILDKDGGHVDPGTHAKIQRMLIQVKPK